jgi:hypothetical protein
MPSASLLPGARTKAVPFTDPPTDQCGRTATRPAASGQVPGLILSFGAS